MIEMTFMLDERTAWSLERVAAIGQRSQSEVVTSAIAEYAARVLRSETLGVGAYRSGRSDVSMEAEEILRRNL